MKKGFVIGLALVIGFALVVAITLTMDPKGKEARANSKDGYIMLTLKIDEATGQIEILDEKGMLDIKSITLDELKAIYKSPNGAKHLSTLFSFQMSPECFGMIVLGEPIVICPRR
ncbi:MAG: hypothetical protein QNI97_18115 [Desulfobacterales bacterium]|nr:hypothetical protein [Desulfobacterales bacterium]